jgi:NADH:ubiquinone reductase (H+-translocating)
MLAATDLPRDASGRLIADAYLRVRGTQGAWTGGDCAAVPDLADDRPDALCAPTAQHAVHQARRLAANLVAELRRRAWYPPRPYRYRYVGSTACMGRYKGVAQIHRLQLCGLPAWIVHRAYHWAYLPSSAGRLRVITDWSLDALFPRDISSLGELEQPRRELQDAARAQSLAFSRA